MRVNVNGAILTTNDEGKAEFNLRAGTYPVKITKRGFIPITETLTVEASEVNKAITLVAQK